MLACARMVADVWPIMTGTRRTVTGCLVHSAGGYPKGRGRPGEAGRGLGHAGGSS
jgi:hypothetical protein